MERGAEAFVFLFSDSLLPVWLQSQGGFGINTKLPWKDESKLRECAVICCVLVDWHITLFRQTGWMQSLSLTYCFGVYLRLFVHPKFPGVWEFCLPKALQVLVTQQNVVLFFLNAFSGVAFNVEGCKTHI